MAARAGGNSLTGARQLPLGRRQPDTGCTGQRGGVIHLMTS